MQRGGLKEELKYVLQERERERGIDDKIIWIIRAKVADEGGKIKIKIKIKIVFQGGRSISVLTRI